MAFQGESDPIYGPREETTFEQAQRKRARLRDTSISDEEAFGLYKDIVRSQTLADPPMFTQPEDFFSPLKKVAAVPLGAGSVHLMRKVPPPKKVTLFDTLEGSIGKDSSKRFLEQTLSGLRNLPESIRQALLRSRRQLNVLEEPGTGGGVYRAGRTPPEAAAKTANSSDSVVSETTIPHELTHHIDNEVSRLNNVLTQEPKFYGSEAGSFADTIRKHKLMDIPEFKAVAERIKKDWGPSVARIAKPDMQVQTMQDRDVAAEILAELLGQSASVKGDVNKEASILYDTAMQNPKVRGALLAWLEKYVHPYARTVQAVTKSNEVAPLFQNQRRGTRAYEGMLYGD